MRDPAAELAAAAQVQATLLPPPLIRTDGWEGAACWVPAGLLGGDLYHWVIPGPGQLGVLLADAEGHGAPAALVAAWLHPVFARIVRENPAPGAALGCLNEELLRQFGRRGARPPSVTALYALFDRSGDRVRVARAGHLPLCIWRAGRVEWMEPPGYPLGWFPGAIYPEAVRPFRPDDLAFSFTDGLQHGISPDGASAACLGQLLGRRLRRGLPHRLCAALDRWLRRRQLADDAGMVVVRRLPDGAGRPGDAG